LGWGRQCPPLPKKNYRLINTRSLVKMAKS
jgi:hypothetical protein